MIVMSSILHTQNRLIHHNCHCLLEHLYYSRLPHYVWNQIHTLPPLLLAEDVIIGCLINNFLLLPNDFLWYEFVKGKMTTRTGLFALFKNTRQAKIRLNLKQQHYGSPEEEI